MLQNKAFDMSKNQYNAAVLIHGVVGDLLKQAAPEDETPLQISLSEVLEVVGKQLADRLA